MPISTAKSLYFLSSFGATDPAIHRKADTSPNNRPIVPGSPPARVSPRLTMMIMLALARHEKISHLLDNGANGALRG